MFEFLRKRSPADSAPAPVDAHAAEHATAARPLAEAASAGPAPQPDDIAIIGLALRLPRAETLDDFWTELAAQRSLISEVSPQRWDKNVYYGDPRKEEDKTNSIWGGFIEHADCFDAEFFNISPREAQYMDPQQRFAMELAWKAIEDAGYRPGQLAGTNTGVYMGVCHWDYAELFEKTGQKVDAYFPPAPPIRSSPIAFRTTTIWPVRASSTTPPARARWCRSIRPCERSATANATRRWPAA